MADEESDGLLQQADAACRLGRPQEALECLARAAASAPADPAVHYHRGRALQALRREREALASYEAALALEPDLAEAHFARAIVLNGLGRHDEALDGLDRTLVLRPDLAPVHNNRGNVLQRLGRFEEAVASYARAIALKPDYQNAWVNRGATLALLRRHEEALADYDRALVLEPALVEAHHCRGNVLTELGRHAEALASYERALALKPDRAEFYHSRGLALLKLDRHEDALADLARAVACDPACPYAYGDLLHTQLQLGVWDDWAPRVRETCRLLEQGHPVSHPFPLLALPVAPALLRKCAELFVADRCPPAPRPLWGGERYAHERIRLGYFSADLHEHATAYLMAELFERHDRARFEVIAFSFGPDRRDAMRARLARAFDRFIDVRAHGDLPIAQMARQLEIDIAIDLKGYTQDCRPGIFALRPAPIQVSYLGFPGTSGASYFDYIIADAVTIPPEHFAAYSEQVVHLPHTYQVNDSRRRIAARTPSRRDLGLPETGFVFCCFNNGFKISPDVFAVWMRLLARVEGSVLWLLEGSAAQRRNLAAEARRSGVDPVRLIFAPRTDLPEHLARQRAADLFLDTFHYNAHTTTSDALWAGLPVLTCLGGAFAGRVAASLLNAVGLPDLVAHTPVEYEDLALRLARDAGSLASIRGRLARQRLVQPLFDTPRFARHIEAAYEQMYARHRQGLPPRHIAVAP